jgi:cobalt-precorrin 5A hydrolase
LIENLWRGVAIIYTKTGEETAKKIENWIVSEKEVPAISFTYSSTDLSYIWSCYDAIIFVMAIEGVVRSICKLASSKDKDPPVIAVDDAGNFVTPILGGHWGANEIAKEISSILGGKPIITTASEIFGKDSVESIARRLVAKIVNPEAIVKINSAILRGEEICTDGFSIQGMREGKDCKYIITTSNFQDPNKVVLKLRLLPLHVGIGSKREVDVNLIYSGLMEALSKMNIEPSRISSISSVREEVGKVAEMLKVKFILYNLEEIRIFSNPCLTPQSEKLKEVGVKGVAEVCALMSSGLNPRLVLRKVKLSKSATIAIATGE